MRDLLKLIQIEVQGKKKKAQQNTDCAVWHRMWERSFFKRYTSACSDAPKPNVAIFETSNLTERLTGYQPVLTDPGDGGWTNASIASFGVHPTSAQYQ